MANLPSILEYVQTESVQSTSPVSESSLQGIGSAVNYSLDELVIQAASIAATNASIAALTRLKVTGTATSSFTTTAGIDTVLFTNSSDLLYLIQLNAACITSADTTAYIAVNNLYPVMVNTTASLNVNLVTVILLPGQNLTARHDWTGSYKIFALNSVAGSP